MVFHSKVYSAGYESNLVRGTEDDRPWDVTTESLKHISRHSHVLDIGCGSCRKSLPFTERCEMLHGLEPSKEMRELAMNSAATLGITNFTITDGNAESLPFTNESMDVVTSFVAPHSTAEVWRVLKPGGIAILEKIGDRDKANIKHYFGVDEKGPRGQFLEFEENGRERQLRQEFSDLFTSVTVQSGRWPSKYTQEELLELLRQTSVIRNFDIALDRQSFDRAWQELGTQGFVETMNHRVLVIAYKNKD